MSDRVPHLLVSVGAVAAVGLAVLLAPGNARASSSEGVACARSSVPRPPTEARPFNLGAGRVRVALPVGGRLVAVPEGVPGAAWVRDDGSIRTKLGWAAPSRPTLTGRRLDRPAPRLLAHVGPRSMSEQGAFYPSTVVFPSVGCWKLTASAGAARLSFVLEVVRR